MSEIPLLKVGDVVLATVRKITVFGLFCEYESQTILVLIPEISWIPAFACCEQVAEVGDEIEIKIIHIDRERNAISGSLIALHPENNPWSGVGQIHVGDEFSATVLRWVDRADRCGDAGGYLLALRPAVLVMLCGEEDRQFTKGEPCSVRIASIDHKRIQVTVELIAPFDD